MKPEMRKLDCEWWPDVKRDEQKQGQVEFKLVDLCDSVGETKKTIISQSEALEEKR